MQFIKKKCSRKVCMVREKRQNETEKNNKKNIEKMAENQHCTESRPMSYFRRKKLINRFVCEIKFTYLKNDIRAVFTNNDLFRLVQYLEATEKYRNWRYINVWYRSLKGAHKNQQFSDPESCEVEHYGQIASYTKRNLPTAEIPTFDDIAKTYNVTKLDNVKKTVVAYRDFWLSKEGKEREHKRVEHQKAMKAAEQQQGSDKTPTAARDELAVKCYSEIIDYINTDVMKFIDECFEVGYTKDEMIQGDFVKRFFWEHYDDAATKQNLVQHAALFFETCFFEWLHEQHEKKPPF